MIAQSHIYKYMTFWLFTNMTFGPKEVNVNVYMPCFPFQASFFAPYFVCMACTFMNNLYYSFLLQNMFQLQLHCNKILLMKSMFTFHVWFHPGSLSRQVGKSFSKCALIRIVSFYNEVVGNISGAM